MNAFELLAEPTRRRILDLLRVQPRLVGELVDLLAISQPLVSKHLRVLREGGMVQMRQDGQRHWYELTPAPLAEITVWLEPYRRLLEERYDRLDSLLDELQAKEPPHVEDEPDR